MVRLAQDGREGKLVYQNLVKNMWIDVDIRSKKLAVHHCWLSSVNSGLSLTPE